VNLRLRSQIISEQLKIFNIRQDVLIQKGIFIQEGLSLYKDDNNNKETYFDLREDRIALLSLTSETQSKTWRFISTFIIVAIASTLSFLLVKSSVDWAGNSKIELNRMKDEELTRITEEINQKYHLNKGTIE